MYKLKYTIETCYSIHLAQRPLHLNVENNLCHLETPKKKGLREVYQYGGVPRGATHHPKNAKNEGGV